MKHPHRVALALLLLLILAREARGSSDLLLLGGRFRVTAEWQTTTGLSGMGEAIPFNSETGMFWFFSPSNIEVVVKVLDACSPPFDRFWIFASGLTDVEVTLTVSDLWSGQSQRYHHLGGSLFPPIADAHSFATCSQIAPACGHGNLADIQASPRPDNFAENLALLIGDGVAAEGALYERLSADLAAIRAAQPALAGALFKNIWWDPHGLILGLNGEAHAAARAGGFDGWSCLNTWFGGSIDTVFEYTPAAVLSFAPLLHPYRIGPDYEEIPGVTYAEANGYGYPASGPTPTPGLCASIDGPAIDYFFEGSPAMYYRVPAPGSAPTLQGSWHGQGAAPAWWAVRDACYTALLNSAVPPPD
jgi:hypothetical protein